VTGQRPNALITGASGGIGRAVAVELARRGYSLGLLYRSSQEAAEAAAAAARELGAQAISMRCDLRDPGAVEASIANTIRQLGSIDLLAHCAGAYSDWKSVRELSPDEWASFLGSDLTGFFHVLSGCLRHMHERERGAIVAVSSIAAQACPSKGGQAAASKAALDALIRVVAREEGRFGIRANGVAVGLTATAMGADAERRWGAEATRRHLAGTPVGRMGTPEEIARAVVFLASDDASYITGKILQVDGGQIIAA
jgi:NAD(P)-dependent dehydrogenase (short-subunit alcohol dehydrogenase family)